MEKAATVQVVRIVEHTTPANNENARLLPGEPSKAHKSCVVHLASEDGTIYVRISHRSPADYPAGSTFNLSLAPPT